jgi:transcriptional regulator with XRE-family HTH domain
MPFDLRVFGQRLRGVRKQRDLSQQALADALGTSHGWISELENARQTHIQADTVYRLCEALGISADYLMGLTDTARSKPPRQARQDDPDLAPAPPAKRQRTRKAAPVG